MTSPTPKPTLREQLDAVRPDSDDLLDDSLQGAARAIEESDEWREIFERQQAFDREVATTMQDLELPVGIKARLLESLATARMSEPASVESDPPSAPVTRRSAMRMMAMAAGLLITATLGWLIWPNDGSLITLAEARHKPPTSADGTIDVGSLAAFDESFEVRLPDSAWERRTQPEADLKGLDWTGDGRHDAAVYEFQAGRVHGYLVILPSSQLADPPTLTRLSTAGIDYQPAPNTAWVSQDQSLTYICYVDQGDLPALQRLLSPHSA